MLDGVLESRDLEGRPYFLELALLYPELSESLRATLQNIRCIESFLRNSLSLPELRLGLQKLDPAGAGDPSP